MTTRDVSAATAAAPHPPTRTLTLIPTNLATIVTLMCFNPLRPPPQDTGNV